MAQRSLPGVIAVGVAVVVIAPVAALVGFLLVEPAGATALKALASPAHPFWIAVRNSASLAAVTTAITIPLGYAYAYAVTQSRIPAKVLLRLLVLWPMATPSVFPAATLVLLFGNQGWLKPLIGDADIYSIGGVAVAEIVYALPFAYLLMEASFAGIDRRLNDVCRTLSINSWRRFLVVTWPATWYGVATAAFLVFIVSFADLGGPRLLAPNIPLVPTEIYAAAVGKNQLALAVGMGLVVLVLAFGVFALARIAMPAAIPFLQAGSVRAEPEGAPVRDAFAFALTGLVGTTLGVLALAGIVGSFVALWPYDLAPTLAHYRWDQIDAVGWRAAGNSVIVAVGVAALLVPACFWLAYVFERGQASQPIGTLLSTAFVVSAVSPGLLLGLGFAALTSGQLGESLAGGLTIFALYGVAHFFAGVYAIAATTVRPIDAEFDLVAAAVGRSRLRLLVTTIWGFAGSGLQTASFYAFVSTLATVSGLVFLAGPRNATLAVSALNFDEAGRLSAALAACTVALGLALCFYALLWGLRREPAHPPR